MCLCRKLAVTVEYGALDRLLYELRRQGIEMGETEYGARVTLHLTVEEANSDALINTITALTSGAALIETESEGFFRSAGPVINMSGKGVLWKIRTGNMKYYSGNCLNQGNIPDCGRHVRICRRRISLRSWTI
jgi:hypothetical protein